MSKPIILGKRGVGQSRPGHAVTARAVHLLAPVLLAWGQLMTCAVAASTVEREDFQVESAPGISIFVREIRAKAPGTAASPLLLVHGGGPGGIGSFDLPVPGYSFAESLATAGAGRTVYIMDVRGWGRSTRPAELQQPADANPPAVAVDAAATDIAAVVDAIRMRTHTSRVALFGWASGGHWSAFYAARHPDRVSHLVLLNTIYGVDAPWPFGEVFADPKFPGRFRASGAYALADASRLLARWDTSIPAPDKTEWRDPAVAEAYVHETIASDPTSGSREPRSVRIPTAYRREAFEMAHGRKYWDAADLRAAVLVIRSELDFWSRPADSAALERELTGAARKRFVTLVGATHYVFDDRPARGRRRLIEEIVSFMDGTDVPSSDR